MCDPRHEWQSYRVAVSLAALGSHPYDARRFFNHRRIMLSTIRGKSKSWVVKALLGILVVAFAAWGIGDILAQRGLTGRG